MHVFTLFLSTNIQAIEISQSTKTLNSNPQWLRLLHYEPAKKSTNILGTDFFSNPTDKTSPAREAEFLLKAFSHPVLDDSHPRCRYPARYRFLSRFFHRAELAKIPQQCRRLIQWLQENRAHSISLLLVGGYMGNPASMFGHAILKFNTTKSGNSLFETTINYGAMVPPEEPIVKYIFKGLFGGYQAGYSDRYFYVQDVVYTNTEARDIWEYVLQLPTENLELLQLHVWEIIGQKKQYFFLTRNCAYELGQLIELGFNHEITPVPKLWFVPIDLFNGLTDYNKVLIDNHNASVIRSIRYHPSAERILVANYNLLSDELKKHANHILSNKSPKDIDKSLQSLNEHKQQQLLNFLLAYQYFLYMQELPSPSDETKALKDTLLRYRLALAPSQEQAIKIRHKQSPAEGSRPLAVGAGIIETNNSNLSPLVNITFFSGEPTGNNSLDGDELTVMDVVADNTSDGLRFKLIDYLRILHHSRHNLPWKNSWSWRVQLRTLRLDKQGYDHQLFFGIGKSHQWENILFYGLLTPSIHTSEPHLRIRPEIGTIFPITNKIRVQVGTGYENDNEKWRWIMDGRANFNLSKRFSVIWDIQKDQESRWLLRLRTHW